MIGFCRRDFFRYPRREPDGRLSSTFASHQGHPRSDDFDAEYLNIYATRTRTLSLEGVPISSHKSACVKLPSVVAIALFSAVTIPPGYRRSRQSLTSAQVAP